MIVNNVKLNEYTKVITTKMFLLYIDISFTYNM